MHCDLHINDATPEQLGRVASVLSERRDRLSWAERTSLFHIGWAWDMGETWFGPGGERLSEADPEQRDRLRCAATGTLLRHISTSRPGELPRCERCGVFLEVATLPCPGRQAADVPAGATVPGPTARDAVVGMLVRHDLSYLAGDLAHGRTTVADLARAMKRHGPPSPGGPACLAALEALAAREACRVGHGVNDACAECAPGEQVAELRKDRAHLDEIIRDVRSALRAVPMEKIDDAARRVVSECDTLRKRVAELEAGKSENERLRAEASRLDAALTRREEDVARVSLERDKLREERDSYREERDAFQMSTEEGSDIAARLRAEAQRAREAGAAEMRQRAASLVLNRDAWESGTKLAERIMALPIGGVESASSQKPARVEVRQRWRTPGGYEARVTAGPEPDGTMALESTSPGVRTFRWPTAKMLSSPDWVFLGGPEVAAGAACDGSGAVHDYGGPFDCAGCAGCLKASAPGDVRAAQDVGGGP